MTNEVDKQPVYDPDYERERQELEEMERLHRESMFEEIDMLGGDEGGNIDSIRKDVEDTTKDTLDKIAKLHRLFCSLYSHVVYGVDLRYIQLNPVFFKRVLKGEKISANWNGDKIMISGMVEDVTVVTLL